MGGASERHWVLLEVAYIYGSGCLPRSRARYRRVGGPNVSHAFNRRFAMAARQPDSPHRAVIVTVILAGLMVGCGGSTGRESDRTGKRRLLIQTDRTSYTVDSSDSRMAVTIEATLQNQTSQPLYVVRCTFASSAGSAVRELQRRVDEVWERAYANLCVESEVIELKPGATLVDTARVPAIHGAPALRTASLPGSFRATYNVWRTWPPRPDREPTDELGDVARSSNEFTILAPK